MTEKQQKISEHLLGISILISFVIPHTKTIFLMLNPILCVLLKIYCGGTRQNKWQFVIICSLMITFVVAALDGVEIKSLQRFAVLLLYLILFPFVGDIRIRPVYLWITILLIIVSQMAYVYRVSFLMTFMDKVYPISAKELNEISYMQSHVTASNVNEFRLGGLFRNSNHCAKYMCFLLAFFLVNTSEKPYRYHFPFLLLVFYSVLLTGSRTGFVCAAAIIFIYIIKRKDINQTAKFVFAILSCFASIFIFWGGSDTYRALNVQQGFDNSLSAKFGALSYFFSNENSPLKLLFGHLDPSLFKSDINIMNYFDGEIGDLIFSYGVLGFAFFMMFYVSLFLYVEKQKRLFFLVLMWMISSTIICSYRSSFVFLLMLSSLYSSRNRTVNQDNQMAI